VSVAEAPIAAPEQHRRSIRGLFRRKRKPAPVSFPELTWAHHLRQQALTSGHTYKGEDERRYRQFEEHFQERQGEIVSAYWSTATASGAAVTVKQRRLLPSIMRLHWATDWATSSQPKLADVLYECEARAVKVCEVLQDTPQRVATHWLFTIAAHVLGFAESSSASDAKKVDEFVKAQRRELEQVRTYYYNAAQRCGQITYLGGALLGILPPIVLAVVVWLLGMANSWSLSTRTGFSCFAAGAVGALVSVMSRMNSGNVRVDWEFGKDTLRTMGSLRPFVGGIFGVAVFFALKSGVVNLTLAGDETRNFFFYVLFSFVAGFSERLAQDMLLGVTLDKVTKPPDRTQVPAPAQGSAPGATPQPAGGET
jgi:hypothetical protein